MGSEYPDRCQDRDDGHDDENRSTPLLASSLENRQ
jgi:hypothetical protein